MEAGMTTAERRRRRRRGGGLRVPSDNVPRRTSTPPVVAPVPEDPSLAMSIAYSFTSDGSEPIPRMDPSADSQPIPTMTGSFGEPVAPDGASTMIDPPAVSDEPTFESKTREMSSVDLKALGLDDPASLANTGAGASPGTTQPMQRIVAPVSLATDPGLGFKARGVTEPSAAPADASDSVGVDTGDIDVDMGGLDGPSTLDGEPPGAATGPVTKIAAEAVPESFEPAPEVPIHSAQTGPVAVARAETQPPVAGVATSRTGTRERLRTVALSEDDLEEVREAVRAASQPAQKVEITTLPGEAKPSAGKPSAVNTTQPLTALDVELIKPVPTGIEGGSVPEIDLNELVSRSSESGEIDVDVDEKPAQARIATPPAPPPAQRVRAPSVPPPPSEAKKAAAAAAAAAGTPDPDRAGHVAPPPPPAAAHKPPPAPPAKAAVKEPKAPPAQKLGKGGKPWFVDLFDEDYLRTLPFLTPQATQSEAEFVIDALGLSPGAQVLDVGCGYGRHAMELAARGFHVVGLDLSTPLLVRGGEEAQRRGLEINFVRGDMRELDFDSQFDGAYCMFSTFGYFDDETNKKTVANIARALKPGGRVLIEILNRDYVIADLPTRVWWEGEGCVVLEEVELNYFSSRIQVNRSVVFDDGRQLEQEISVRAYSLHEVGKLMHAAGFRVLEVSGGYHTRGRFFGNQSRHIIVLAERKDPSAP
jgi:SAM-dependent methyltransferase